MKNWKCHNPYFNRWFSAILKVLIELQFVEAVTILILIDGFLQFVKAVMPKIMKLVTILILIDGFLQSVVKLRRNFFEVVTILILIDGFLQYKIR